jgi:uncharacterized protein involved in exopolysaccharide biosynthesis
MAEDDRTAKAGDPNLAARRPGSHSLRREPSVMYSHYRSAQAPQPTSPRHAVPPDPSLGMNAAAHRHARPAQAVRFSAYRAESPDQAAQVTSSIATDENVADVAARQAVEQYALHQVAQSAPDTPLLDMRSVIQVGWTYRKSVIAFAIAGAVLGSGFAMTIPKKYSATATLYFDPTSIRTNPEGQDINIPSEVMKATIDSQTKIITLDSIVRPVVLKLRLAADPAFGGKSTEEVVGALKKAIKVTRADDTYVTEVKVTTGSASQSAKIANELVSTFLEQDQEGKLNKYASVNSVFQTRLDDLRKQVEASESAVEQFRAANDLVEAEGELIAEKRLTALNELLVTTQQATIAAKSKLESATRLDVNDVVNGNLKEAVASTTLGSLRVQYANLSTSLGRLESQLGSRHPSLIAAKASLETLKDEIRNELSRMVSSAKDEYAQAAKAEKDLRNELAAQKAFQSTSSPEMVQLKELERKATAAKEIYEAVLKRAGETTEEKNLFQSNIRVVAEAVPPLTADAPGRSMLAIAGLVGGGMFGLIAGLVAALIHTALLRKAPRAV